MPYLLVVRTMRHPVKVTCLVKRVAMSLLTLYTSVVHIYLNNNYNNNNIYITLQFQCVVCDFPTVIVFFIQKSICALILLLLHV